jgi:hypothetical protein
MFFPKLNGVFNPTLGIRTNTEPKTMTGILMFTIIDFYSCVSQVLNTSIHRLHMNDAVILAYHNKRRGEVFRKNGMAGVGDDDNTWFWEIIAAKSGGTTQSDIANHPGSSRTAPQGIIRNADAESIRIFENV